MMNILSYEFTGLLNNSDISKKVAGMALNNCVREVCNEIVQKYDCDDADFYVSAYSENSGIDGMKTFCDLGYGTYMEPGMSCEIAYRLIADISDCRIFKRTKETHDIFDIYDYDYDPIKFLEYGLLPLLTPSKMENMMEVREESIPLLQSLAEFCVFSDNITESEAYYYKHMIRGKKFIVMGQDIIKEDIKENKEKLPAVILRENKESNYYGMMEGGQGYYITDVLLMTPIPEKE